MCISFMKYVIFICFDTLSLFFLFKVLIHPRGERVSVSIIKTKVLRTKHSYSKIGPHWNLQLSTELIGS